MTHEMPSYSLFLLKETEDTPLTGRQADRHRGKEVVEKCVPVRMHFSLPASHYEGVEGLGVYTSLESTVRSPLWLESRELRASHEELL